MFVALKITVFSLPLSPSSLFPSLQTRLTGEQADLDAQAEAERAALAEHEAELQKLQSYAARLFSTKKYQLFIHFCLKKMNPRYAARLVKETQKLEDQEAAMTPEQRATLKKLKDLVVLNENLKKQEQKFKVSSPHPPPPPFLFLLFLFFFFFFFLMYIFYPTKR
jgi:hypothetical protein